jgi:hypothetical protein
MIDAMPDPIILTSSIASAQASRDPFGAAARSARGPNAPVPAARGAGAAPPRAQPTPPSKPVPPRQPSPVTAPRPAPKPVPKPEPGARRVARVGDTALHTRRAQSSRPASRSAPARSQVGRRATGNGCLIECVGRPSENPQRARARPRHSVKARVVLRPGEGHVSVPFGSRAPSGVTPALAAPGCLVQPPLCLPLLQRRRRHPSQSSARAR